MKLLATGLVMLLVDALHTEAFSIAGVGTSFLQGLRRQPHGRVRSTPVMVQTPPSTADLRDPPEDSGLPLIGRTADFALNFDEYFRGQRQKLGPVFKTSILFEDTMVFQDPGAYKFVTTNPEIFRSDWPENFSALFGAALFLIDGAKHKKHRQIVGKAFTPDALDSYMPSVTRSFDRSVAKLKEQVAENGGKSGSMLGVNKDIFIDVSWDFLIADINDSTKERLTSNFRKIAPGLGGPANEFFGPYFDAKKARNFLIADLKGIARRRRTAMAAGKEVPRDALTVMLTATAEDGTQYSLDELANELIFLTFAAYDTTGAAATNFLFEASKDAELLAALRREQAEVQASMDGEALAAQIKEMPVMEAVLNEVFRYHPSATGIFRRCVEETQYLGYRIPKGQKVWAGIYLANRGEGVAGDGDGDSFCPYRYTTNSEARASNLLTFSSGAHYCLGSQLARRMLLVYLSTFLRTFDMELVPGQDLSIVTVPSTGPRSGLELILSPVGTGGVRVPAAAQNLDVASVLGSVFGRY